jgi:hypothetical protein
LNEWTQNLTTSKIIVRLNSPPELQVIAICLNHLTERLLVDLMSETFNSSHQPAVPCNEVQLYCNVRSSSPSLLDTIYCAVPNSCTVQIMSCICMHYFYSKINFFTYLVFFLISLPSSFETFCTFRGPFLCMWASHHLFMECVSIELSPSQVVPKGEDHDLILHTSLYCM